MKNHLRTPLSLAIASVLGLPGLASAQLVINDTLSGANSPYPWKALNGACLTAGDGTGTIPKCVGLNYYAGKTLVGGVSGVLPDPVKSGALRLTNGDNAVGFNGNNQTGAIVSDFTFPTNSGLSVTWTSVTYGGNKYGVTGTGADGISFFLSDGGTKDHPVEATVGALGGSLGYSCSNGNGTYDGVIGGYLGVGIDEYGNFSNPGDNTDTGPGFKAGRISLRGAGSTAFDALTIDPVLGKFYPKSLLPADRQEAIHKTCRDGYAYNYSGHDVVVSPTLTIPNKGKTPYKLPFNYPFITSKDFVGTAAAPTIQSQEAVANPVRGLATPISYTLRLTADGLLDFSYSVGNGGATQTVVSAKKITDSNGPLPASFRFGFSGGTGGGSNVHEITCFKAAPPDQSNSSGGSNVNSGRTAGGSQYYVASYHPVNWWGQLTAQSVLFSQDANGNVNGIAGISTDAVWDASCVLTGGTCNTPGAPSAPAQGPGARSVLTWNGDQGVPFTLKGLSAAQQASLGVSKGDESRLQFLRGDRTQEVANGGPYRTRASVLGDIVDSGPTWVGPPQLSYAGPWIDRSHGNAAQKEATSYQQFASDNATRQNVVYAGANDGMLHGFRAGAFDAASKFVGTANDGREVLAYVPGQVIASIHPTTDPSSAAFDYSSTQYAHNFYVDGTPGTGDLYYNGRWHTWLVGGLGAGGHATGAVGDDITPSADGALFALDVTDPGQFSEANARALVLGEWTPGLLNASSNACVNVTARCGDFLGQQYGTPLIRRLHDGNWAVLFGNGLNSVKGSAGLFIMHVNANSGARTLRYLDTGYDATRDPLGKKNLNGISYVTSADLDADHITDYVYAGDLFGNLWRFDLTSTNPGDWKASPRPLFSASTSTQWRPISTRVTVNSVSTPSATGLPKVIVAFGTGLKLPLTLTSAETFARTPQFLYGIWDSDMTAWNGLASTRFDSQPAGVVVTEGQLQAQTVTGTTAGVDGSGVSGYRTVSQAQPCWKGSTACGTSTNGNQAFGWKFVLPGTSQLTNPDGSVTMNYEQGIYNPITIGDAFVISTAIPGASVALTCNKVDPTGYTMAIDLATGGAIGPTSGPIRSFFADASGSFTSTNISGISMNAVGTVTLMQAGGKSYAVSQTYDNGAKAPQINPPPTPGKRVTWNKAR